MKKILLGTSALLVAGFVSSSLNAAPIKLNVGGYANWYTGYVDGNSHYENSVWGKDTSDFPVLADVEITFNGETVLANGLKFGAVVELRTTTGSLEDQSFIYVDGAFGRVAMGRMDSISEQFHTASKDVGLLGIQDSDIKMFTNIFYLLSTDIRDSQSGQSIVYISPEMSGVTLAASYTNFGASAVSNNGDNRAVYLGTVAYKGKVGGFDIGSDISYGKFDSDFDYMISAGLRIGINGFTFGGGYKVEDVNKIYNTWKKGKGTVFDLGVAYEQGPYGVSLSYINSDNEYVEMKTSLWLASVSYNISAGIDTFASLGYETFKSNNVNVDLSTGKEKAYVFATGLGLTF